MKSARKGNIDSQLHTARLLAQGIGTKQDHKSSFSWYEFAAANGSSWAQLAVANGYLRGVGVDKDLNNSFVWFEKSARQGEFMAQYVMGISYCDGNHLLKDLKKCAFWLNAAHKNKSANLTKENKKILTEVIEKWKKYELWKYK